MKILGYSKEVYLLCLLGYMAQIKSLEIWTPDLEIAH